MNIIDIFNRYTTREGIPFLNLTKHVVFPEDKSLDIYKTILISEDTPWTVLSYQIYKTIDYWWILCSLNKENKFYAPEGSRIYYIDNNYIKDIIGEINRNY